MRVSQEIRVIDLLARREAEFLRVKECEDQIAALLAGEAFPFPPPPVALPSSERTNAKKAWRPQGLVVPVPPKKATGRREAAAAGKPTSTASDTHPSLIAPLQTPEENAYLVHFHEKEKSGTSFLNTSAQVQALLDLACASFRVTKVEAVRFRSLEDFDVLRQIWEEPPSPQNTSS